MSGEATEFIKLVKQKYGNKSPKVILDIGSRDLGQSIEFSEAFPESRILAFEPNPEIIPLCRSINIDYPKIELCEFAVSDTSGIIDFYITDRYVNAGASSMLEPVNDILKFCDGDHPDLRWKKVSGIMSYRLDLILPVLGVKEVDIVWLDVQGIELRVLKGMGKFLDKVKMIHTEASEKPYYKGHILKTELEDFLTKNNFLYRFQPAFGHYYGEGDLICIRRDF